MYLSLSWSPYVSLFIDFLLFVYVQVDLLIIFFMCVHALADLFLFIFLYVPVSLLISFYLYFFICAYASVDLLLFVFLHSWLCLREKKIVLNLWSFSCPLLTSKVVRCGTELAILSFACSSPHIWDCLSRPDICGFTGGQYLAGMCW